MKSLFDKTKAGAIVLKNRFVRASVGHQSEEQDDELLDECGGQNFNNFIANVLPAIAAYLFFLQRNTPLCKLQQMP